jgi:hypothetical protein
MERIVRNSNACNKNKGIMKRNNKTTRRIVPVERTVTSTTVSTSTSLGNVPSNNNEMSGEIALNSESPSNSQSRICSQGAESSVLPVSTEEFNQIHDFDTQTSKNQEPITESSVIQKINARSPSGQDFIEWPACNVWKILWSGRIISADNTISGEGYEVIWDNGTGNKDKGPHEYIFKEQLVNCDALLDVFEESKEILLREGASAQRRWNYTNQRRTPTSAKYGLDSRSIKSCFEESESVQILKLLRPLGKREFTSKLEEQLKNYCQKFESVPKNGILK